MFKLYFVFKERLFTAEYFCALILFNIAVLPSFVFFRIKTTSVSAKVVYMCFQNSIFGVASLQWCKAFLWGKVINYLLQIHCMLN